LELKNPAYCKYQKKCSTFLKIWHIKCTKKILKKGGKKLWEEQEPEAAVAAIRAAGIHPAGQAAAIM
jgi:hypothetical protein